MNGKVLSKKTKKFLLGVILASIKIPFWAKPFTRALLSTIINILNKKGDKVIPDKYDASIEEISILCGKYEWDAASIKIGELLDTLINVKHISDEFEKQLFVNGAEVIARVLQNWIQKQKKE